MKKTAYVGLIILFLIPFSIAADLEVEILDEEPIIITEIEELAEFTLAVKNNENLTDRFQIFSLAGLELYPRGFFTIAGGETKELDVQIELHTATRRDVRGLYIFEYQIKGQKTGFFTDRLAVEIIDLKDAVTVKAGNVVLEEDEIIITAANTVDFDFEEVTIAAESVFFEFEETTDFNALEDKKFSIPIEKDKFIGLTAGEYDMTVTLSVNNKASTISSSVRYVEGGSVATTTDTQGLIIRERTITKTNEGNVNAITKITQQKDVLSRLFTTFSRRPETIERNGLFIEYAWEQEISPAEEFAITTTTNYTVPFILLLIVIAVIIVLNVTLNRTLRFHKSVSFVKTHGGEFALKVRVKLKAKKALEDITVTDRLPRLTKLYKKFGTAPHKIDHKTRQLIWHVKKLNAGEERAFTYIIYSKINVLGRFELPAARIVYAKDSKTHELYSNKAYFAAETTDQKAEEK